MLCYGELQKPRSHLLVCFLLSTRQLAMQRELGTSLADLAAFIHEQGLTQGKDVRGIERLRLLALNLQSPSQDHEVSIESG